MKKDTRINQNNSDTLVIKYNDNILFRSQEKGLKSLYNVIKNTPEILKDAEVFDTIVGKAAAMMYVEGGISKLETPLISESAAKILESEELSLRYSKKVPAIYNQAQTDLCPMEKIASNSPDFTVLLDNLDAFFGTMNKT